jgi:hypothetical protein
MHDVPKGAAGHCHGHDGHSHSHQHSHGDGAVHSHAHSHDDCSPQNAVALLSYMTEHNSQHTNELYDLAHELEHAGLDAAAALIHDGAKQYSLGNELLAAALKSVKEG